MEMLNLVESTIENIGILDPVTSIKNVAKELKGMDHPSMYYFSLEKSINGRIKCWKYGDITKYKTLDFKIWV